MASVGELADSVARGVDQLQTAPVGTVNTLTVNHIGPIVEGLHIALGEDGANLRGNTTQLIDFVGLVTAASHVIAEKGGAAEEELASAADGTGKPHLHTAVVLTQQMLDKNEELGVLSEIGVKAEELAAVLGRAATLTAEIAELYAPVDEAGSSVAESRNQAVAAANDYLAGFGVPFYPPQRG